MNFIKSLFTKTVFCVVVGCFKPQNAVYKRVVLHKSPQRFSLKCRDVSCHCHVYVEVKYGWMVVLQCFDNLKVFLLKVIVAQFQ